MQYIIKPLCNNKNRKSLFLNLYKNHTQSLDKYYFNICKHVINNDADDDDDDDVDDDVDVTM